MISLNDRKWQSFEIGDLFDVSGTTTTHPSVLKEKGDIPRITCQAVNNGLEGFYSNIPTENGGVLTVDSATDGAVNYQGYDFIATDHVEKISRKDGERIDRLSGIFLVWAVKSAIGNKYNYGYKFSQNRIRKQTILLPVTEAGEPDYDFMRSFVAERESSKRKEYVEYAERQLAQIERERERERVDNAAIQWRMFRIGDLFEIRRPAPRNKDDYAIGDINFVASGATNNGVMKSCQPKNGEKLDTGNCMSVSPVDGSCFYQPIDFLGRGGAGSSIILLYPKNKTRLNKYIGLSLSRLIYQTTQKYTYGHMANRDGVARDKIMLPTKNGSDVDYAWLENCAKVIMYKKYLSYLNYVIS